MGFLNWFIDPIIHHYFDFKGRATRKEYWMFILVYLIISILFYVVGGMIGTDIISIVLAFAVAIPSITLAARRLHDTGLSGWWQLVSIIPFIGLIILIVLLARGSAEANKYGPKPGSAPATFAPANSTPVQG